LAWYLFLFVALLLIGYGVWTYRRRVAERDAASRERFERIFGAIERAPQPARPPAREAGSSPAFAARERLLGETEALLYRLLRSGLPDHEIFAQVPLSAVVGVPEAIAGAERERRVQWLARQRLDFVICDRDFRVIAAVEVEAPDAADASARQARVQCLKAAGIRFVRLDPAAPPAYEALRALVCGSSASLPR
jgi:hypothetical protein